MLGEKSVPRKAAEHIHYHHHQQDGGIHTTHTHISGKISIPLSLEGNSNIHRVHLTFFPALCYAGAHKFRVVKVTIVVSVTHPKSTIKDILEFFIVINLADFIRICVCGAQNKHTI